MSTSARRYLLRITVLLCVVGGVATSLFYAYNARRLILEKTDARLHTSVAFLHELLGPEFHDQIADGESLSAAAFQSLLDRNDDLCRRLGLQYLWSVLVLDEDTIVFTSATRSDLSDPGSAHAAFFEPHRDPRAFDDAMGAAPGQPVFSSFHNEWGAGRMVLVPRLDAAGRRYILGASLQTTALRTLVVRATGYGLLMAGALFTLIWFVMRSRILRLTQVLSALDEAAIKMAGGDLEVILPTSDVDEVRHVCASLETMRREIKKRIEDLVRSTNRERRKSELLSRLTHGESLELLLDAVVRFTEQEDSSIRGSILLFDPKRNLLQPGAAPSLPGDYNALMAEGLPIGPNVGSCGTAAFTRKLAIAANIQTDPRWTPYTAFIEKTREHDLKACWSLPILAATGEVLGAFANYSNHIGEPTPENLATLTWAADLAALAIEKHQAKYALRESEERYRGLFDGSIAAIYVFDPNKRFVDTNQAGIEFLGYTREELRRMSMQDADVDPVAVAPAHQELLSGGKLVNFEHRLKRKDGTIITVLNNSSPLTDAEGKMIGMISTLIDITAQKQAEAEHERIQGQLAQAQKMESVGRLAGGVAHDFNNMLMVILGETELAMEQTGVGEPLRAHLDEIRKAAQRSADLTRRLLAFARKQTVAPEVLDLNETVNGMLSMLRRLIGEDIDLVWRSGKAIGSVWMDPSQVDQILANLCVNARDAIADTGTITIETRTVTIDGSYMSRHDVFVPGDYILLTVSDTGRGMDAETLGHLFEPFFTTKGAREGTGLGLATVYGIVKQNRGLIDVYSEPGLGSTFKIYLPRHTAKAEPRAEQKQAPGPMAGGETVLLVEDEQTILKTTTRMLAKIGYTVVVAESPGEALRLARAHPGRIDLLLTDVVMPEMNGRDLAENLLSIHPEIKRLFMSGYPAGVIAHHGVLDPGVHFIQKPFSTNDLAAKIQETLKA